MHTYLVSLAIGAVVGVLYGVLGVRSPAPPIVALLGLLGMLLGEAAVEFVRVRLEPPHAANLSEPKP